MQNYQSSNILLVEDELLIAATEVLQLKSYGYNVCHIESGEESIEIIIDPNSNIDLILMDIDLGLGLNGTQAAEQILKVKDIPIIFLSSHTEPEIVKTTEKITSYGYVVKNSGITVLDASIKMALKLFNANIALKQAEYEARIQKDKFYKLFENMNEEVHLWECIRNEEGEIQNWRLVDINPAGLKGWAKTKAELIGKTATEIWHDSDPIAQFKPIVEKIFKENQPYTWETYFSGTKQTLKMTSVPFGEFFFSTGFDISDYKNLEEALKNQVNEKEILLKEVYHRISNSFNSLISIFNLQSEKNLSKDSIDFINESIGRIEAFKKVYEKLLFSSNQHELSLRNYIEELATSILNIFDINQKILMEIESDEIVLDYKKVFPIGAILNELIINSMKYAFQGKDKGKITIRLTIDKDYFELKYQDDGIGLPTDFDFNQTGFGFLLLKTYTSQLKGKYEIINDNGLSCTLSFKI
jgi:two-component sensor histidine kinase/CheY-like chemotaxis protein